MLIAIGLEQAIEIKHFPDRHFWHAGYEKAGKVWADAGGHGYWLAGRRGMELLEMRR